MIESFTELGEAPDHTEVVVKVRVQLPRPSKPLCPQLSPRVSLSAPTETRGSTAGLLRQVWHGLTLEPRVRAYVKALKAASHADAKLPDIEEVARERLRDAFQWSVFDALDALGLDGRRGAIAKAVPELAKFPLDYGDDIWTIRSEGLRDLVLRMPPPIGLQVYI